MVRRLRDNFAHQGHPLLEDLLSVELVSVENDGCSYCLYATHLHQLLGDQGPEFVKVVRLSCGYQVILSCDLIDFDNLWYLL
jgi:hypothetical protein